jgi:DNA-directed RNA polymerase II subunit RPB2
MMSYKTENMSNNKDSLFDLVNDEYIETPWNIIQSYFQDQHLERLVRHQLESYNNFITYQIIKTIEMFNPVHIKSENDFDPKSGKYALEIDITFENFQIYRPQIHENNGAIKLMFPQEARLRNFTYAAAMTIDMNIRYTIRSGENLCQTRSINKVLPNIHIGKMPIMLKSSICVLNQYKHIEHTYTGECKYDAGGYFIINGSEKTVLGQERAAENKIYCYNVSKNNTKYTWMAEIKSVPDFKCISPKQINMMIASKNNGFGNPIHVEIPRLKQPVPLFVVFRALGIISDKEICEKILLSLDDPNSKILLTCLHASIIDANKYTTTEEAIKYLTSFAMYTPLNMDKETGAKKKYEFTMDILHNDLFPHCHNLSQKVYFLGYMANKLLQVNADLIKGDDRDSYLNKRIDLTGTSLNNLFRNYFNKLVKDMEKQVIKEINTGSWRSKENYEEIINLTNIYKIIKNNTIENGFKRALATGDFGIKNSTSNKVGVAQVLNRLTYISSLSHLRRISTPIDKSGKLVPPRKLHPTSWGFICPVETPEGQSIGVVKNLSSMCHITIHSNSLSLYEYVNPHIVNISDIQTSSLHDKVKVFINGAWVGITNDASNLYKLLKEMKHKGIINIYTSIVFDYKMKEIRVCNDSGRVTRPVMRVKNNQLLLTKKIIAQLQKNELMWDDLFTSCKTPEAVLEYIDPDEQNYSMIASEPKEIYEKNHDGTGRIYRFTHCEIHPSNIFGVVASCIPFPDHNQSPRNTYQSAQQKQAMGIYATNFHDRLDKTAYVMTYPTRPLVDTRLMNMIKINEIPSGCNITVAIMTHTGYNQEDSVLINKGSIDRGLFQITIYHTEKDEDKQKINGDEEIRCKPDKSKTKGMKMANYDKLTNKGIIPENTLVEDKDIIISKVTPIKENRNDPTKVIKFEDQSIRYKTVEETYIDKNYIDRNGDGYSFAKVRLRALRKPVIGDKFCLTEDHDVLTSNRGWVPIKEVTKEDLVAQLNFKTARIEYVHPIDTYEFRHDAPLYEFEGTNFSQLVTGYHRLPAFKEKVMFNFAEDIYYNLVNNGYDYPMYIHNEDFTHSSSDYYVNTATSYNVKRVEEFKGNVYCLSVPSEVFLIRRNGKCSFTGNCSRHGQKGTVGNIIPEADMPFTRDGSRPDIIINPHAIPSRMTIGQLKETLLGKVLVQLGLFGDGTSFGDLNVESISKQLLEMGYEAHGNELLHSGLTGQQVECSVFMGPVFYQRLKHMVNDKQHSRAIGPMVNLTRQPAEGRSRDGGLRFGEMERDAMISHGAARFTRGRMYDASDKYQVYVCKKCGMIASYNDKAHIHQCRTCDNRTDFAYVEIPYACKLLTQELITMNVAPRFLTE